MQQAGCGVRGGAGDGGGGSAGGGGCGGASVRGVVVALVVWDGVSYAWWGRVCILLHLNASESTILSGFLSQCTQPRKGECTPIFIDCDFFVKKERLLKAVMFGKRLALSSLTEEKKLNVYSNAD